jgi:small multidrug resistance pump/quaternary ammonium compound-resistance protein SugE
MSGSLLYLGMMVAAALAFTVGGIFMKLSQGLTQPLPSLAMLGLFAVGAALLTLSIELRGELGPAYLVVLGLEAVLALAFGAMLFGEEANTGRLLGVALLVLGMILIEGGTASAAAVPETPAGSEGAASGLGWLRARGR